MKFKISILILFAILSAGISGYMIIEDCDFLNALYMTIITLTTVGYKEVHKLSNDGMIFTIILIITGISYVGYFASNAIALIVSGELNNIYRGKKMEKMIGQLIDHVIVCGYGRVGKVVCDQLTTEKKKFIIIEKDPEKGKICLKQGFLTIIGDATDEKLLKISGLKTASSLITTLNNTAENTFVVLAAKEICETINVIARGSNETSVKVLYRAGASSVISPSKIGGKKMAYTACHKPTLDLIVSIIRDENYDIKFAEVELSKDAKIIGKTLITSNIKHNTDGIMVIGVKPKNGQIKFNPPANIVFEAGDKLIILGNRSQLQKLKNLIGLNALEIKYIEDENGAKKV